jgi:Zn-dependent protease with chaperone function
MIGVAVISLVLFGFVALATSAFLALAWSRLVGRLNVLAPEARTKVIATLFLSPGLAGALVLLLSFGPCIGAHLAGLPDTCAEHGGPRLFLCLHHDGSPSALAWFLVAGLVARGLYVLFGVGRAALMTSRLARLLRRVGSRKMPEGYVLVPGNASFTAGALRGDVFVGADLAASIDPVGLAVVIAHERAHQRHHHVLAKIAARAFAVLHLPWIGRRLTTELDTALEQACDLEAARAVGDPLLVADSLIAVARLRASTPEGALAGFADAPDALARRVNALCSPSWGAAAGTRVVAAFMGFAAALLVAVTALFDRPLHDVTEALLQILGS